MPSLPVLHCDVYLPATRTVSTAGPRPHIVDGLFPPPHPPATAGHLRARTAANCSTQDSLFTSHLKVGHPRSTFANRTNHSRRVYLLLESRSLGLYTDHIPVEYGRPCDALA